MEPFLHENKPKVELHVYMIRTARSDSLWESGQAHGAVRKLLV
jgi:hypothetical protein